MGITINKQIFAKNLSYYLDKKDISRAEMARQLGYPETTVSNWANAVNYPRIDKIQEMADFFGILKSDLTEDRSKESTKKQILNENYDKLSDSSRTQLVDYSMVLLDNEPSIIEEPKKLYSIWVYEKVAAGNGYSYGAHERTKYYTDRNNLKPYDFATRVVGDSMEPVYEDGEIALVRRGYDNTHGGIYIVDYDGKTYMKKVFNDGDRFRLVSINDKYENIIIEVPPQENTYFNIVGRVVDHFTPVDTY